MGIGAGIELVEVVREGGIVGKNRQRVYRDDSAIVPRTDLN
jgi:hypothetical protein